MSIARETQSDFVSATKASFSTMASSKIEATEASFSTMASSKIEGGKVSQIVASPDAGVNFSASAKVYSYVCTFLSPGAIPAAGSLALTFTLPYTNAEILQRTLHVTLLSSGISASAHILDITGNIVTVVLYSTPGEMDMEHVVNLSIM